MRRMLKGNNFATYVTPVISLVLSTLSILFFAKKAAYINHLTRGSEVRDMNMAIFYILLAISLLSAGILLFDFACQAGRFISREKLKAYSWSFVSAMIPMLVCLYAAHEIMAAYIRMGITFPP